MKKAIKYLEERINALAVKYQYSFYAGYEYDAPTETFFVEVLPESQYNEIMFKEDLADVILDFEVKFPQFSLCFVSNDRLVKLENPIRIVEPKQYEIVNSVLLDWKHAFSIDLPINATLVSVSVNSALDFNFRNKLKFHFDSELIDSVITVGTTSYAIEVKTTKREIENQFGNQQQKEKKYLEAA